MQGAAAVQAVTTLAAELASHAAGAGDVQGYAEGHEAAAVHAAELAASLADQAAAMAGQAKEAAAHKAA